jgi:predicted secreted acid phosphatase
MINPIQSFSQIPVIPKSLVVLDIDETVLTYANLSKKWWIDEINRHYLQTCNYADAEKMALSVWKQLVPSAIPISLDTHNRRQFVENAIAQGCQLIFLTARHPDLWEITQNHLNQIGNYNGERIYYDENKGTKLVEIIEVHNEFKNIIVVDDLMRNLNSIHECTKNRSAPSIQLYYIQHHLESPK